ncbi:hypothetical protein A2U01_0000659 [Trifolium medium]|uniref:Uncharacterized protein n=1 Tax=Trifolium medium TaxID=97028 RepID=A0A392LY83_9FABA|nr:hypothetical protein [Trifolium medium]
MPNNPVVQENQGQMPVTELPRGWKIPKFTKFTGDTSESTVEHIARDLVQKALNEGRLKFDEKVKPQMNVDSDPLQVAETSYAEPFDCLMVEAMEVTQIQAVPEKEYAEKIKVVYPRAEEELVDFLNSCKLNNTEVMLCPRCSAVCDKEATAGLKNFMPFVNNKGKWPNQRPNQGNWPHQRPNKGKSIAQGPSVYQRLGRMNTFIPSNKVPINQWAHGQYVAFNKKVMEKGSSSNTNSKNVSEAKKYSYKNNYKGKNPMTRTQWRRFQSQKKLASQNVQAGGNANAVKKTEVARRPIKERISPPNAPSKTEDAGVEDEFMDDDILESDGDLDIPVNIVSILPIEYDVWSEITDEEDDFEEPEMANHKPVCYYVMNNGYVEEQQAVFEKPDEGMKNHLKPLFIRAKVNNVGINKVLIDRGVAVNLIPHSLLRKIGKYYTDLHSHNIVLSNYEGKTGHSMGAIQVDVCVGSTIRLTFFLVVPSKANYNLMFGR